MQFQIDGKVWFEGSSKLNNIDNKLKYQIEKVPKSCKFFYNFFLDDNND